MPEAGRFRPRFLSTVLAVLSMGLSFMVLDRLLTVFYGFNFQPYGPDMPPAFPIWGHLGNGAAALLGVWLTVTGWRWARGRRYAWLVRAAVSLIALGVMVWIPYNNDAEHLAKHGESVTLPLYLAFNAAYVFGAGWLAVILRNRWRLVMIVVLVIFVLVLHFAFYLPIVPGFHWV